MLRKVKVAEVRILKSKKAVRRTSVSHITMHMFIYYLPLNVQLDPLNVHLASKTKSASSIILFLLLGRPPPKKKSLDPLLQISAFRDGLAA